MKTGIRVVAALLVALMLTDAAGDDRQRAAASAAAGAGHVPGVAQGAAGRRRRPPKIYNAGAIATNIFLVPGRAITCVLGGAVGIALLAATLGTAYRAASGAVHEGCGGKWTVSGDDLRPEGPTARPFDWEKRWE